MVPEPHLDDLDQLEIPHIVARAECHVVQQLVPKHIELAEAVAEIQASLGDVLTAHVVVGQSGSLLLG